MMNPVDVFTKLYNQTFGIKNSILRTLRIQKVLRFSIMLAANIFLPFLLKYTFNNNTCEKTRYNFTVCLTSFPNRIKRVHLVVYSLLLQDVRPNKIVLYLSKDQFPSLGKLPKELVRLSNHGLDIVLVDDDLRAYKKYFYHLSSSQANFAIVDDDIFYPSNLLSTLYNAHLDYPRAVCANRCAEIIPEQSYRKWSLITSRVPVLSRNLLPTGCGGVFYPKNSLNRDYALDTNLFNKLCPDADDIWLNVCAFIQGTDFYYTGAFTYYIPVINRNDSKLHSSNVGKSGNDYKFKSTREYFMSHKKIDVLKRSSKEIERQ